MTLIYEESIPCEVLKVNVQYGDNGSWTTIKIKPKNGNNFYISESNINEDTLKRFISAYKNNEVLTFTYRVTEQKND